MEEMNNGLLTLLSDAVQMFVYFSIILDDCWLKCHRSVTDICMKCEWQVWCHYWITYMEAWQLMRTCMRTTLAIMEKVNHCDHRWITEFDGKNLGLLKMVQDTVHKTSCKWKTAFFL
jgi:hypothetical protein